VAWRERCRQRRAEDLVGFDAAWLKGHHEVPAWLKLDPQVVRVVKTWLNIPSMQQMYEFHKANAEQLADPAVPALIEEYAMVNPDVSFASELLDTAAKSGIEEAYAPVLLGALIEQLEATDAEGWPRLLAQHRDLLSQLDLVDVPESTREPKDQLLTAALWLAARDKDSAVFAAAAHSDRVRPLLEELADDPKAIVNATALLLAFGRLGPAETTDVQFARAIALARVGQSKEAESLAATVAAAEPERKPARLQELAKLTSTAKEVVPLLPAFS
jgi:hypothetical protein